MRNCLLALAMLLALAACQQKKTISPARYAPEQQAQQPVLAQPAPASQEGAVQERDVAEAATPQRARTPVRQPARKAAPQPQPQPAPQPEQQPAPQPAPSQAQPAPRTGEEVTYQIGVFTQQDNATALARRAEEAGFKAEVETDERTAVSQHRVLVTYVGSDSEARSALLKLGVYDPILVGGRVDPTAPRPRTGGLEPQPQQQTPPTGGLEPQPQEAATPRPTGVSYQVGAFAEAENATQIKRQLEEDGFHVELEETGSAETRYRVIATWPGTDEEGRARLLEHDIFDPIIVSAGPQAARQQRQPAPPPPSTSTPASNPAYQQTQQAPRSGDSFRFQVGAFSAIENAEALRAQLEQAGYRTEMELIEEQGAPKYRVLASKRGNVPALRQELMGLGVLNPILLGY